LALILAPLLAQAQQPHIYLLHVVLNGVTYQGEFVWTPNTVNGCVGTPTAGRGTYSAVSILDPPVTLTYATDTFYADDCLGEHGEHLLWFTNGGGPFDLTGYELYVIPSNNSGLGAASVPIASVTVYQLGAMVATCSPCAAATMTEIAASANGTTIPSATNTTQIVDSQHNLWTMNNGKAFLNGTATPSSAVIMLLYSSGIVYQENFHHDWWKWVSGKWVADTSSHAGYSCPAP
jgi:hypothetical protein